MLRVKVFLIKILIFIFGAHSLKENQGNWICPLTHPEHWLMVSLTALQENFLSINLSMKTVLRDFHKLRRVWEPPKMTKGGKESTK